MPPARPQNFNPRGLRQKAVPPKAAHQKITPQSAAPPRAAPSSILNHPSPQWEKTPPEPPSKIEDEIEEAEWARQKNVRKWRQFPMFVCGMMAFGIGTYGTFMWISLSNPPDIGDIPEDVSDRFDKDARGYDEKVGTAEWMLRMTSRRNALAQMARGHVLECAVGTGRNTPYYSISKILSITLLDQSKPMLEVAKRKWNETHPGFSSRVHIKQQSALDPITPPYGAQDGYDTVIQTMGICSTPEPVRLLRNLESVTKEDSGHILLLEHGKSHYGWLNDLLDKTAPAHANEHGCWWNKDIGKIVEESGLEIVNIKRYNFGTTWWVELKPRKGSGRRRDAPAISQESAQVRLEKPETRISLKAWWEVWK
ncbi:S-adenosyl-L-methionine-dependent methyltransferase [Clohesyomyces aquaticus]|uniref:S-adenosyl-L-methionine-dependent methyltransferase n=1 Tax=Clohesyomyces aquaticus TaxID=1231657 RepID=A0A1Y1ZVT5_9PLEO|nr:S-adenosyl-L-methionine-dependent methyltransferase [Clohesyomyces aquaticus]